MSPANLLRTALQGVAAHKLRSTLTALGVIIGVASVIAMLALGNGARAAVEAGFRFLGSDQIQIGEKMVFEDGQFQRSGERLSYEDGLLIQDEVALIYQVEMGLSRGGRARFERQTVDVTINGVTAQALESVTRNAQVQPVGWPEGQALQAEALLGQGRFFSPLEVQEGANVCVLGYDTAFDLFQGDDPLGETVVINRERCTVVGVMAELESSQEEERYRSNPNLAFYLPISTLIRDFYDEEPSVSVSAYVSNESRIDEARDEIAALLRQRHAIEADENGAYADDFNITTRKDILGAQQEAARTFSLLLAAMAVVSLAVGGIGIMNVMLVSVTERTREIGVRLALGARRIDVIFQFLLESILISTLGGIFGVTAGVLAIPLAASLNDGNALLAPNSIPLSLGVAMLTGVLFGLYPALRAARMDPIEALRYE